ncbi:MAG: CapA family protein [Anaerolineales bacterium]|nr:CapA family protein [Anaerolineales bacterium]
MQRRLIFYGLFGFSIFALLAGLTCGQKVVEEKQDSPLKVQPSIQPASASTLITLFMAGDIMIGRGIDQVLLHPSDPLLHEPFMPSAKGYVELAERVSGPIQQPVNFAYIWGDALAEWQRVRPDVRLINLETSITTSNDYWPDKGIHYRLNPQNIAALTVAGLDYCSLANNHVLDWGYAGLTETLEMLQGANIHYAGAGQNLQATETPAVMDVAGKGRVIVFAYGLLSSGIPLNWAASADQPGVNLLPNLADQTIQHISQKVEAVKQPGDIVVVSIHWGGNWGYEIPAEQTAFAHHLIDQAGVDIIHGHSSHHVKGLEVYQGRPIIYGSGDLLNDYEGISGHEQFRADLALMYFVTLNPATGQLVELQLTPMQIKHFKVNRASSTDALWLSDLLNREGQPLGTRVEINPDNTLTLRWD